MSTTFSITDFGAVGDGKTICTAQIQAALDAAGSCKGTVEVPAGIYLTGKLTMREGTVLTGSAAWSFGRFGASIFKLCDENVDCMIDITGAFGCAINGMSLDGGYLGKNIHGIKLYWEKYNGGESEDTPTIDNCRIGCFSGNGLHFEHVWCFSVRHSMLCFNAAGLYMDGWDAFIIDNWLSGNRRGGLLGGPCTASITATGNRVEWNDRGGFIFRSGDSINVTGNFFDRSGGPAIIFGGEGCGCNTATVTGNIFRRSGKPFSEFSDPYDSSHIRLSNSQNITIIGNSMLRGQDDGGGGVLSPDYSLIMTGNKCCIFKDNTMLNADVKRGMILNDNIECIIKDNIGLNE